MKNNFIQEVVIAVILIFLSLILLNPFGWFMPNAMVMSLLAALLIITILFTVYLWREKARDEREAQHIQFAGRVGFILGVAILTLGLIKQSIDHSVDPWLAWSLIAMVLAKIIGLIYSQLKR